MATVTLRSGEIRDSGYDKHPDYRVWLEPSQKRLRVQLHDAILVDTTEAMLLYETRHLPVYYFPRAAIAWDHFTPTEHATFCPFKGEAYYWSIEAGDRVAENAMWSYPEPLAQVPTLNDYVAFYWNRVDHWFEEDEEIFVHPRDPYVRVDTLPSSRRVEVAVGGRQLADSTAGIFLFETGLPPRYYLPADDVETSRLKRSETRTRCPYKGEATHFDALIDGERIADVAWCYEDPVPEVSRIRNMICFYDERVERISLDGVAQEKPRTKWSPKR